MCIATFEVSLVVAQSIVFWTIAKSTTENEFQENMQAFRDISKLAADDLMSRNYKKRCRAFYTSQSCCNSVDNNMSEVFNAYILNSRHNPLIGLLEDIREGLMERLHKKSDYISKKSCRICPRIQKQLETQNLGKRVEHLLGWGISLWS